MKISEQTWKTLEQLESTFHTRGKAVGQSTKLVVDIIDITTSLPYVSVECDNETSAAEKALEQAVAKALVTPKPMTESQKLTNNTLKKQHEEELARLKAELEEAKKLVSKK